MENFEFYVKLGLVITSTYTLLAIIADQSFRAAIYTVFKYYFGTFTGVNSFDMYGAIPAGASIGSKQVHELDSTTAMCGWFGFKYYYSISKPVDNERMIIVVTKSDIGSSDQNVKLKWFKLTDWIYLVKKEN